MGAPRRSRPERSPALRQILDINRKQDAAIINAIATGTVDPEAEERIVPMRTFHIVPFNDLREHDASRDCWCRPRAVEECSLVFVHNSMDRRELYERGDLLPA